MAPVDPLIALAGGASLLFATAFTLAFVTLACAPGLLTPLWKVVKGVSVVSVAIHVVTTTWPAVPAHPWARLAVGLGHALAGQVQASAWEACQTGFRLLVPLLVG